jgi:hypothetical protein
MQAMGTAANKKPPAEIVEGLCILTMIGGAGEAT